MAQSVFFLNPWVALYQEKNLISSTSSSSSLKLYVFYSCEIFKPRTTCFCGCIISWKWNIQDILCIFWQFPKIQLDSDLNLRIFFLRFMTIFLEFWLLKTKFCVFERSSTAQNEFAMRVKGVIVLCVEFSWTPTKDQHDTLCVHLYWNNFMLPWLQNNWQTSPRTQTITCLRRKSLLAPSEKICSRFLWNDPAPPSQTSTHSEWFNKSTLVFTWHVSVQAHVSDFFFSL